MNPAHPVYVISKGRANRPLTVRELSKRGVPFRIVVEPQEAAEYASVVRPDRLLTLPFSNLGQGSIPARNWVWEHALAEGHASHWILDDNISDFFYLTNNVRHYTECGSGFRAIEDFAARYENLALCGMQYEMFAPRKAVIPPVAFNTRIYSCILIRNDLPFRWRGRYNEDTDLSLRVLKAGWCTALFNVFLCDKTVTMKMKGGNTDELYKSGDGFDGRLEMAKSLQQQHPDVTTIKRKWGRWQHHVDYRPFKGNALRLKPGVVIPEGPNNFGMVRRYKGEPLGGPRGVPDES